jgi:hypothetical protein
MTYGFVMDVEMPVEMYDAVHAEVLRRAPDPVEGLLLHVGRATARGFQVMEVWDSKEQCERYEAELVGPVIAELAGDRAPQEPPPREEFEPRGLVVPARSPLLV